MLGSTIFILKLLYVIYAYIIIMQVHRCAREYFVHMGTDVDVDVYPWWIVGAGTSLGFNPRVWVYISSTRV
jgi:hypothetical protein